MRFRGLIMKKRFKKHFYKPKLEFYRSRDVQAPDRANYSDAGLDFFIPSNLTAKSLEDTFAMTGDKLAYETDDAGFIAEISILPNQSVLIPSGIHVKVPRGWAMIFHNKSGLATKRSLVLGACVVDEGYQGEVMINLHNIGNQPVVLNDGDKLAQGVLLMVGHHKLKECDTLEDLYRDGKSERGEGGFGSTGN